MWEHRAGVWGLRGKEMVGGLPKPPDQGAACTKLQVGGRAGVAVVWGVRRAAEGDGGRGRTRGGRTQGAHTLRAVLKSSASSS